MGVGKHSLSSNPVIRDRRRSDDQDPQDSETQTDTDETGHEEKGQGKS